MIAVRCISVFQHPAIFVQVIPFTVAVLSPGIGQISTIFLFELDVYKRQRKYLINVDGSDAGAYSGTETSGWETTEDRCV